MKRITALLLTATLCLCLAACSKALEPEQSPQEIQPEEPALQSIELIGPWHLDGKKNDIAAFSDRFPGYAEWGASMEIRSDGQMSWYIGAEGWHGTYVVDDETIHAELDSELEERTLSWDLHIVIENESAMLEMDYEDMAIYWRYGDQEDTANGTCNE